jgi:Xaa-Pro dipeptidase
MFEKELPFSIDEYNARLAGISIEMQNRGIDVLVLTTPENIYYVSGFGTKGYYTFQALVISSNSAIFLVTRKFELINVSRLSWVDEARVFEDTEKPADILIEALKKAGLDRGRIGVEMNRWFLPAGTYADLNSSLPFAEFVNGSGIVEKQRVCKSPKEIEYIRKAADTVSVGMKAALDTLSQGVTENDVAGELYKAAIKAGSEYMAGQPYVASGYRSALPHATWQGRKIEYGDVVYAESSANVRRYSAALIRTAVIGKPDHAVKHAAEAVIAGLESAIDKIKPGVTSGDVDFACRNTIGKYGLAEGFFHRTGYSIGVGFSPAWGEGQIMDLKPEDTRELRKGMVFHIVPIVFISGVAGVGFSETVLVTDTGAEVLTNLHHSLLVKE